MKDFNREEMEKKMLNYIPDESIRSVLLDSYSLERVSGFEMHVSDRLADLPCFRYLGIKESHLILYVYIVNFYRVLPDCDFSNYLKPLYEQIGRTLLDSYLFNDGYSLYEDESGAYLLVKEG